MMALQPPKSILDTHVSLKQSESPRVLRRLFGLSHAAIWA